MNAVPKEYVEFAKILSLPLIGMGLFYVLRAGVHAPIPPMMLKFVSLPIAMVFWWMFMQKQGYGVLRFSKLFFGVCLAFYGLLVWQHESVQVRWIGVIGGMLAGYFVWVDGRAFLACAYKEKRAAVLGLFMALASAGYAFSNEFLWQEMAHSTAVIIEQMIHLLGMDHAVGYNDKRTIMIANGYLRMGIYDGCSGMEGVFLFSFLLSAVLLMDWKFLKSVPLINLFLLGFVFMFLVNMLRIFVLFLLYDLAANPASGALGEFAQGWPKEMAHSTAGWIFYFAAFCIYVWQLYRYVISLRKAEAAKGE